MNKKFKVAFIIPNIFSLGGEQRLTTVISNLFLNYNYDVNIICTEPNMEIDYSMYSLNKKIKILNIKYKKYFLDPIKLFRFSNRNLGLFKNNSKILEKIYCVKRLQRKLIKVINENNYDFVIAVGGYYSMVLASIKNQINSKIIGWQLNSFDAYFQNPKKYYWNQDSLFKRLIPNLDSYVLLTKYDQKKTLEYFNCKTEVIYNPVSFTSKRVSQTKNKQFIAIGRYTTAKGFDLLIESFNIFSKQNKDWKLIIIGEGEDKTLLENLIKKYNLDKRVKLHGKTKNIEKFFLDSKALLLSSRWEGMPMVVTEAMELGVPVISYDIPVCKEIINDYENGLLVKSFDTYLFAEKMLEFSNNEDLQKKLSKNIKKSSKMISQEVIGRKWKDLLERL